MADVSIDTTISSSTSRGMRGLVVHPTDPNIIYAFAIDGTNDFGYHKSTDGGATWGAVVDVGPDDTDLAFDVWADWWTPGDTGTLIHLVWFGTTADDVFYENIDITDDSQSGAVVVEAETSAAGGVGTYCSITKAVGGNLYIVWELDASGERGFEKSTDGGASWAAATSPQEALGDYAMLFPANLADTQDIWAVYFDVSDSALTLKTYDNSGDSWAEAAITGVARNASTDGLWQYPFTASVRHSDGHLIVTTLTSYDLATTDHRVFDITNGSSIAELTAITTDIDDHFYPSVFIDQTTEDIYVFYNGKRDGSETLGTASKVYYTKSTDDGTTWSSGDTAYMEAAVGLVVSQVWAPLMGPRACAMWRVAGTLNFNAVNSIDLAPSPGNRRRRALLSAAA